VIWKLKLAAAVASVVFVAGSLMYAYSEGKKVGAATVQQKWDANRADIAQAITNELAQARQREQALQDQANRIQQERRNEIARLTRQHAAALDGLRNRPDRPADSQGGMSTPAGDRGTFAGCTGGELSRQDAEFLIGEAVRADQLRLQLAACQAAYREALKAVQN